MKYKKNATIVLFVLILLILIGSAIFLCFHLYPITRQDANKSINKQAYEIRKIESVSTDVIRKVVFADKVAQYRIRGYLQEPVEISSGGLLTANFQLEGSNSNQLTRITIGGVGGIVQRGTFEQSFENGKVTWENTNVTQIISELHGQMVELRIDIPLDNSLSTFNDFYSLEQSLDKSILAYKAGEIDKVNLTIDGVAIPAIGWVK